MGAHSTTGVHCQQVCLTREPRRANAAHVLFRGVEAAVVADMFPVVVTAPDGTVQRDARVLLTKDRLYTFTRVQGRPTFLSQMAVTGFERTRARWDVTDADGGVWTLLRQGGCGCANPLKRVDRNALLGMVA